MVAGRERPGGGEGGAAAHRGGAEGRKEGGTAVERRGPLRQVARREVLAQYDVDAQARDGEGQLYSGHVLHSRAGWSQSDAACAA